MRLALALLSLTALMACRHRPHGITFSDQLIPPRQEPAPADRGQQVRVAAASIVPAAEVIPEVVESAEPPPVRVRDMATMVRQLNGDLVDAFFDYDRSDVRPDAVAALRHDAALLAPILAEFGGLRVVVEGHCDERGSAEYNLGLGDRRSRRAVDFLAQLGVPAARVDPLSYGKEAPQCTEETELCRQRNRRAHLDVRP